MARVYGQVLGLNSGIIGPVMYKIVKGIQYASKRPDPKPKGWTPSEKQKAVMDKFTALNSLATSAIKVADIGLAPYNKRKPYYNPISSFIKLNYDAVELDVSKWIVAPDRLQFSWGNLCNIYSPNIIAIGPDRVTVRWATEPTSYMRKNPNDYVMFVFYDEYDGYIWLYNDVVRRQQHGATLYLLHQFTGHKINMYVFTMTDNQLNCSKTLYVEKFVPQ